MMTKTTSSFKLALKLTVLLPLSTLLIFLFSTKLVAQVKQPERKVSEEKQQKSGNQNDTLKRLKSSFAGWSIGYTQQGVSQELLDEYQNIVNKYKKPDENYWKELKNMSGQDRARLETIFKQMSVDQQYYQEIGFLKSVPALPKVVPTKQQFEQFKNPKQYGIWINEKRVQNSELNKYENTDFSQAYVSKLHDAAKKGRSYDYQVNLMTNDFYKDYYNETMSHINDSHMVVIVHPKNREGLGMNRLN
jgi:hypothetical protein